MDDNQPKSLQIIHGDKILDSTVAIINSVQVTSGHVWSIKYTRVPDGKKVTMYLSYLDSVIIRDVTDAEKDLI